MKNIRILTLGIAWTLSIVISMNMVAMQSESSKAATGTPALNDLNFLDDSNDNPMIQDNQDPDNSGNVVVGKKRTNETSKIKGPAPKKPCPNSTFEKNSTYLNNCKIFLATITRCFQDEANIPFEQFKKEIAIILAELSKLDPSNNQNNNITTEIVDYQNNRKKFDLISNFINKTSDITWTLKYQPMSFANWATTVENFIKAEENFKEKTKTSNRWYWGTVTPLASLIICALFNGMIQGG